MKRSELLFNIASIPVDLLSLLAAGFAAFYTRVRLDPYIPITFLISIRNFLNVLVISAIVLVALFALLGLYNLRATRKFSAEFGKIISAISIALLAVIVIFFFDQKIFPSRLIVLVAWFYGILVVVIGRYILKKIQVLYLNRGYGLHKVAVIIDPKRSERPVYEEVKNNKALGYKITAELKVSPELIAQLEDLYSKGELEEILQADPNTNGDVNLSLVQFARDRGLVFNFVPNLFEVQRNVVEIETIQGIPVISLKNTPLDGWGKLVKRIFDIVVSALCIVLTLPFFLIIIIMIKLDSPGKVFYAAKRGGFRKDFVFYKFRTMYAHMSVGEGYGGEEAERMRQELWKVNARGGESGPFLKIKDDPRVTRMGKFLRKTHLDEIPQFINVLRGDMSMVGPRPHVIDEVERYRSRYRRLFTIKPGIFGLSQIAQLSWPDLPFEEEIRLNTYYIENWSLWMDVVILAKSFYHIFVSPKTNY